MCRKKSVKFFRIKTLTLPATMTEITIRPLTPADAAAFKALRLQGLQEIPSAFGSSYEEECDTPVEELARRFAPQAGRARFGAFDGEHLVGIAGIGQEEKRKLAHRVNLWGMYVAPAYRGRGVAQQLIQAAIDAATALSGARQLHLSVNTQNKNALRLYLRTGFQIYGQDHGALLIDGVLHDEYLMQRPLTTAPVTSEPESATESVTAAAASGLPPEYRLLPAIPAAGTYLHLRQASGLSPKTMAAALRGLPHSQFAVQVLYQGEAVGMGRVIGDGGCFYQVTDICLLPAHRGMGIAKHIMQAIMHYLHTSLPDGAYVSLIADGEANKLYSQFGFQMTAPKSVGMAMVIRKPA